MESSRDENEDDLKEEYDPGAQQRPNDIRLKRDVETAKYALGAQRPNGNHLKRDVKTEKYDPGALQRPNGNRPKQDVVTESINQDDERRRKKNADDRNGDRNVAGALHILNGVCSKQDSTGIDVHVGTEGKKQQNEIGQKCHFSGTSVSGIGKRTPLPPIKRKRKKGSYLKKLSGKVTDVGLIPNETRDAMVDVSEQKTDEGTSKQEDKEAGCPSSPSEKVPEIKPLAYCRFIARFPVLSFGK